jgi:FMN phosphatase YigB (HAD superfamily)
MTAADRSVVLLDVDNTLLDNDRIQADLSAHLERDFGVRGQERYWEIFETRRAEFGYADYLGTLQCFRSDEPSGAVGDPRLLQLSSVLLDYPFADRLYPGALEAIARLQRWGTTVILSDGDVVFQPRKIQRSGLWDAVNGRVLIYIHKEAMLADLMQRYPASHYVLVDDKLRILAAMKSALGSRLTTVFARQGHFARDPLALATYPAADVTIDHIGELRHWDRPVQPVESVALPPRPERP